MPHRKAKSFKVIKQISIAALDAADQLHRLERIQGLLEHSIDHLRAAPRESEFLLELVSQEFETEIGNLSATVSEIRRLLGHPLEI